MYYLFYNFVIIIIPIIDCIVPLHNLWPRFPIGPLGGIQCLQKFLLVYHHWGVHVYVSIGEHRFRICSDFINSSLHVLIVLIGWWEVKAHSATYLWAADFSILSRQFVALRCTLRVAFCVAFAFRWYNHTVLLTWLDLGRIPDFLFQRDLISIQSITCQYITYLCICWHHLQ